MRKLPVFFVVDVSESMAGPAHEAMADGIAGIVSELRKDPQALELVHIAIIAFAGKTKVLVPMTELVHVYPPELPIGGGTCLGTALETLMAEIDANVVLRSSEAQRGDWRPVIFLMTDGVPTDAPERALARWATDYAQLCQVIAVSVGAGADHAVLRRLSDDIIVLRDAAPSTFARFLNFVTQSLRTHSNAIERQASGRINLSKDLPDGAARLEDIEGGGILTAVDERVAVFVGRCQHSEAPYLLRYERDNPRDGHYRLRQTLPLKTSFFNMTADGRGTSAAEINAERLAGTPSCPHCGASHALVSCGNCRQVHCIDGPGEAICPWCGTHQNFVPAGAGDTIVFGRSAG